MTTLHELGEDIRKRVSELAYLMWETAGRQQGMALEYWVAAEREVMATAQAATERMMPAQGAATPAAEPVAKPKALPKPKAAAEPEAKPAAKAEPAAKPAVKPDAPTPAPAAEAAAKPKRRTAAGNATRNGAGKS
jgi:hypothetical protein